MSLCDWDRSPSPNPGLEPHDVVEGGGHTPGPRRVGAQRKRHRPQRGGGGSGGIAAAASGGAGAGGGSAGVNGDTRFGIGFKLRKKM